MNLIDEQHVPGLQPSQDGRHIPSPLDGRAGGDLDVHPHFMGDDVAQSGLAQARRSVDDDVVQGLVTDRRSLDGDAQIVLDLGLPDKIGQPPGPQRRVQALVVGLNLSGDQPFGHRHLC